MSLILKPIFQKQAFSFVKSFHRHNKPPVGSVFQLAAYSDNKLVGVAIVGRPVSRKQQFDGMTLEVTRLCTDGTKNACSFLYSACWRVAREMGYMRLITYTLSSEPGTSLKAAGWLLIGQRRGYTWNSKSRPRIHENTFIDKVLYQKAI